MAPNSEGLASFLLADDDDPLRAQVVSFLDDSDFMALCATCRTLADERLRPRVWIELFARKWQNDISISSHINLSISSGIGSECERYKAHMQATKFWIHSLAHTRPYMDMQGSLSVKDRAEAVDMMIAICHQNGWMPQTICRAVSVLDKYLSTCKSDVSYLEDIAIMSLRMAVKFEEGVDLEFENCVCLLGYEHSNDFYTNSRLLRRLYKKISLYVPRNSLRQTTVFSLADYFCSICKTSSRGRHLACYFIEKSLYEHDILRFLPAKVCASLVIVAINHPRLLLMDNNISPDIVGPYGVLNRIGVRFPGVVSTQLQIFLHSSIEQAFIKYTSS